MAKQARKSSKRKAAPVNTGRITIQASYNNTLITVSDAAGNALGQSSAGAKGFRGSKKSTPFAAQEAAFDLASRFKDERSLKSASLIIRGAGPGRDAAVRGFVSAGIRITDITDDTRIPFNGCRPRKKRRV